MHSPSRSENGDSDGSASFYGFEEGITMNPATRINIVLCAVSAHNGFHSKVLSFVSDDALDQQEEEYAGFESIYNDVCNAVEELLLAAKNTAVPESPINQPAQPVIIQQQPLKMPIPTFDGSYAAWPKFKAIFNDLMANSGDTDAIKLYHLDKALVGNAAGALDAKILSEGNYKQAWDVLMDRYDNKRAIIESHYRGLLSLKTMSSPSYKELRALVNEATNRKPSLSRSRNQRYCRAFFVFLIVSALDSTTRQSWESTMKKGELPKYKQTIEQLLLQSNRSKFLSNQRFSHRKAMSTSSSQSTLVCDICGGSHRNVQCSALSNLTLAQKNEKIRAAGVCYNCLRKGHRAKDCPSDKACHKCQRRHHTLLHHDGVINKESRSNVSAPVEMANQPSVIAVPNQATAQQTPALVEPPISTTCSSFFTKSAKTVLLQTALVEVFDINSQPHLCRVLLDSGSQVNFVTEEMANRLGLLKTPANVPIVGINALRTHARDKVKVQFRSRVSAYHAELECLVTPRFHTPDKVDLLIGGELFFDILKPSSIHLANGLPQLRDTHFGWVVAGVIIDPHVVNVPLQYSHTTVEDIERKMQQFWQTEEVPNVPKLSTAEIACEAHFLSTYQRNETGRFIVKLPFKENLSQLGNCRSLALKRFLMLEKRLIRNPELQTQYVNFIREYESSGHCREVAESEDVPNQQVYYLPHHAVLRPSSSSTKCRVVFDASAKSSPLEVSLNDSGLHRRHFKNVPPDTRSSIDRPSIFENFLERKAVVTFARVGIMHCHVRHCLGTRCLLQLAEEDGREFPIATRILKEETYMDDVLSGADSVEQALEA
ncbi:uncharacterized protein LOC129719672 [Wyeomyia smithii]|uniref:uncharacterized protein LOC129719672 n=1 Tax=Wyeomyia smithii TaxID=174621 RepID=UPI002467EB1D|nr:uncharacterized protein LOC129719672 [Wyeomyia smithii]